MTIHYNVILGSLKVTKRWRLGVPQSHEILACIDLSLPKDIQYSYSAFLGWDIHQGLHCSYLPSQMNKCAKQWQHLHPGIPVGRGDFLWGYHFWIHREWLLVQDHLIGGPGSQLKNLQKYWRGIVVGESKLTIRRNTIVFNTYLTWSLIWCTSIQHSHQVMLSFLNAASKFFHDRVYGPCMVVKCYVPLFHHCRQFYEY